MADKSVSVTQQPLTIPPDDPLRKLAIVQPTDQTISHIGVVGDTYTILLTGKDTAGRFCLIDMYVPPGGGPPPTDTISKRLSLYLKENSTLYFEERNK